MLELILHVYSFEMDMAQVEELIAQRLAAAGVGGQAASTGASSNAPSTEDKYIGKLDSRLQQLFQDNQIERMVQAKFGEHGLINGPLVGAFCDSRDKVRAFMKSACGYDHEKGTIPEQIEVAKVVVCVDSITKRVEVENENEARRIVANLPVQLQPGDLKSVRALFEKAEYELTEAQVPSEPYFTQKVDELTKEFLAEPLTEVASLAQQKRLAKKRGDNSSTVSLEASGPGSFCAKITTKPFFVNMPTCSEDLRARLLLLWTCIMFVKLKNPSNGRFQSATMKWFTDHYLNWLFGDKVWGYTVKQNGVPRSCPSMEHVMAYDQAVREDAMDLLSKGLDIVSAMERAKNNNETRMMVLLSNFTCSTLR